MPGIPHLHWFGFEGEFTVVIMEIMGPNISELFDFC